MTQRYSSETARVIKDAEPLDCYMCGDGIEAINGNWRHIDDSISVEGERVISTCYWGKPYAPPR